MARKRKKVLIVLLCLLTAYYCLMPWGFCRPVTAEEAACRMNLVEAAEAYLGRSEADSSYREIIDLYNAQDVLPQDYVMKYTDSWCAAFVSAAALNADLTSVVPTECSCQRLIDLLQQYGDWEERDTYSPQPGDLIFYDWDEWALGDSQGWADHVGIVVGTKWPFIKVIEGNWKDSVGYHYTFVGFPQIRGYGTPPYSKLA